MNVRNQTPASAPSVDMEMDAAGGHTVLALTMGYRTSGPEDVSNDVFEVLRALINRDAKVEKLTAEGIMREVVCKFPGGGTCQHGNNPTLCQPTYEFVIVPRVRLKSVG